VVRSRGNRLFNGIALTALLAVASPVLTKPSIVADWAAKASEDITASHNIIRDNHPGPRGCAQSKVQGLA